MLVALMVNQTARVFWKEKKTHIKFLLILLSILLLVWDYIHDNLYTTEGYSTDEYDI